MYKNRSKLLIGVLVVTMIVIPVQEVLPSLFAQTQWDERINEAEQVFFLGQFSKAEAMLREALQSGELTTDQKTRAYRVLGLTYLSRELENQAKETIQSLLEIVPDYQPNPDQDPPQFIRMVEDVREQQTAPEEQVAESQEDDELQQLIQEEQRTGNNRTWLYVVGGVVVAAVVAVLVLGGGGGQDAGEPLPNPPALP